LRRAATARDVETSAGRSLAPAAPGGELAGLAGLQHSGHLVRLEQAGQAEVVLLLGRSDRRLGAELAAVEEHAVERRLGLQRLEPQRLLVRPVRGALRPLQERASGSKSSSRSGRSSAWSRSRSISPA
jgi:hypothetical protein